MVAGRRDGRDRGRVVMDPVSRRRREAVLQLDRAACRHDRRGEQRDDVRRAAGEQPGRRRRSAPRRSAGRRSAATGGAARDGATTRAAAPAEQVRDHAERPERRRQRREAARDTAHLSAELAAVVAIAHVPAREAGRAHAAVMGVDQVFANLGAGRVARLACLGEADSRPNQQRLDGRDRDAQRVGDVDIRHAAQLAHQQRRALLLREALDVGDQAAQRVSLLDLDDRVLQVRDQAVDHLDGDRVRTAQLVDAAVVGDPVQPRPERELAFIRAQAVVRAHEDLLDGVLGILAGPVEHLARVREQPRPVAVMDHAERIVVACPEQRHELLVGADPQQRRADRDPAACNAYRCWECGGFH